MWSDSLDRLRGNGGIFSRQDELWLANKRSSNTIKDLIIVLKLTPVGDSLKGYFQTQILDQVLL